MAAALYAQARPLGRLSSREEAAPGCSYQPDVKDVRLKHPCWPHRAPRGCRGTMLRAAAVVEDAGPSLLSARDLGTSVTLKNVRKEFVMRGNRVVKAIDDVSLQIKPGEFVALLGPSGSGKTTLLRMIAGLESCTGGQVYYGDTDVTDMPVQQRNIGFCFQSYALFKHMTVADNIAFGPRVKGQLKGQDKEKLVTELLELIQLPEIKDRFPAQLSGGQRQRVALARALALRPQLLLLDEPFGALDALVRGQLRTQTRELLRNLGITTLIVTHDQSEAFELADRVVVINRGRIEQVDTPAELIRNPKTPFVTNFVGAVTQVPSDCILVRRMNFRTSKPLVLVRPGDVEVFSGVPTSVPTAAAQVEDRLVAGPTVLYSFRFDDGVEMEVPFSRNADPMVEVQQRVYIHVAPLTLMGATKDEISYSLS